MVSEDVMALVYRASRFGSGIGLITLARGWFIERARTKKLREELEIESEQLVVAMELLETYGRHDELCGATGHGSCTCGYATAWSKF